jgi:2-isopropylmalate synthase
LCEAVLHHGPAIWTLEAFTCNAGSGTVPSAAVVLWHQDGTIHRDACMGDGPIDAVFQTIERITGVNVKLKEFTVRSVTVGEDAQGEANIEAELNGRSMRGRAVSTDIIEASALAFLQVINRALIREELRMNPQTEAVKAM